VFKFCLLPPDFCLVPVAESLFRYVTPAKAGGLQPKKWIHASAGMTNAVPATDTI
jgi:hypothetical protein